MQKKRPKHLDIGKIRLPIPGIVSILHRISGVALFFPFPSSSGYWLVHSALKPNLKPIGLLLRFRW